MKMAKSLVRNLLGKSARFVPIQLVFLTITELRPPLQRAPTSKSSKPASRAKRNRPSTSKKSAAEPIEEDAEE